LVLFAGAVGSGKTTLLASLLEQFHTGPVGDWSFAGSQTLLGFLQRSFYASLASGKERAHTLRTRMSAIDAPWLHLALANDGLLSSLLLADISGEHFREVAAGGNLGEATAIVKRVDLVVHLLDCESFKEVHNRQLAATRFRATVRRMADGGMFKHGVSHVVVLTKADTVSEEALAFIRAAAGKVAEKLGPAPVIATAARPKGGIQKYGIVETLDALAVNGAKAHDELPEGDRLARTARKLARTSEPLAGLRFVAGEDVDE
jgi:hypothetical protein